VGARGKLFRSAKVDHDRALAYSYRDRRTRKRDFRRLWITRINAACRQRGLRYGEFIHGLTQAGITVNRKMMSELAIRDEAAFDELVSAARAGAGS
jgi:large subunit ribosomal protein L20